MEPLSAVLASLASVPVLDAILAAVVFEGALLLAWRARTGEGVPVGGLLANLASGFSLMLALRIAVGSGAASPWIAPVLLAALLAHLADLVLRWEGRRAPRAAGRRTG